MTSTLAPPRSGYVPVNGLQRYYELHGPETGTPMKQSYRAKSPHPEKLQTLLDELGAFVADDGGWTDEQIAGTAAPTLITVGDCDMVRLEHAVHLLRLRGGDVNGDVVGVPASQLAVLPGTTHLNGLARPALVHEIVTGFLDS